MGLLDRAVAHFKGLPTECIEVPEWGDENGPAKLYYTIPTLADVERAQRVSKGNFSEMAVRLIVMKAQDESGSPLFQQGDHLKLMKQCDPAIVSRISAEISKHLAPPDPKEAEKNSETISED